MAKNYPAFITELEKTDPKLYESVANLFDLAMAPGELDGKTKILIAMTLDAFDHSPEGVKTLANVARHMGATEGQIAEALRIAYMVAGNQTLATANAAFEK